MGVGEGGGGVQTVHCLARESGLAAALPAAARLALLLAERGDFSYLAKLVPGGGAGKCAPLPIYMYIF